jgi:hypothetical protein
VIDVNDLFSHAAWDPARQASLYRLLDTLPRARGYESRRREHASIWAGRVWDTAEKVRTHVCILNDDVIVPKDFPDIVEAMVRAVPDECLSLHTTAPAAAAYPGPWVRSSHYTGPAVVLPPGAARALLDFRASLPWWYVARINEDELAALWAFSRQRPFYCAIPSPVMHDVSVPSTLGYDHHPHRTTSVPWTGGPVDWTPQGDPPFVECAWNPSSRIAYIYRLLRQSHVCVMCLNGEGIVGMRGSMICRRCADQCERLKQ